MDMNIGTVLIRDMESEDYRSVAEIWRNFFDSGSITDESVVQGFSKRV